MSRILIGILLLVCVLRIMLPTVHVAGQSGIVVNNADTIRTIDTMTPSANLNGLLNTVQHRIAVQYANNLRYIPLATLPAPFQTLIESLAQQIVVQYANNVRHVDLIAQPADFQSLLVAVPARVVFQYASGIRQFALGYPRSLLNDQTPPVINNFTNGVAAGAVNVRWNTDEFTRCTVHYGTRPGAYTEIVALPLYAKAHETTLAGAIADTTYYVQITCTDQSENAVNSAEFNFTVVVTRSLFLPLIRR